MPRVYERKFDWDEARRLRAEGWTYASLADRYGVSPTGVQRVCDERLRARMSRQAAERQRSTCIECGAPCSWNRYQQDHPRCRECFQFLRRTTHEYDPSGKLVAIRCVTCREWKKPDAYARDRMRPEGRHHQCGSCSTIARREYRHRHAEADRAYHRERRRGLGAVNRTHVDGDDRCRDCRSPRGRYHLAGCSLRADLQAALQEAA